MHGWGEGSYFLRPWPWWTPQFKVEILQGTWESMGKEYMLSTSWPGHGAWQHLGQGWQQMFSNVCILKRLLTSVVRTKSWKCNSAVGFPWLHVVLAVFKKCREGLWRFHRNLFESTARLSAMVVFLIQAHAIGNPSVKFPHSVLPNKARTSCELVSAWNNVLHCQTSWLTFERVNLEIITSF